MHVPKEHINLRMVKLHAYHALLDIMVLQLVKNHVLNVNLELSQIQLE